MNNKKQPKKINNLDNPIEKNLDNRKDFIFGIEGLNTQEVEKRIKKEKKFFQYNEDKKIKDIIFNNLCTVFNLFLLVITIVIVYIGRFEQLFFLIINSLNITISIFQEINAKKALNKICLLTSKNTKVIRDKKIISVKIENILTQDILFLELGSQIIADAKIKKGIIEVNEALLTGESKSVFKKEGDFLYSGSYVISGIACAQVISIGDDTYIYQITKEAKKYKKIKTPLTQGFSRLIMNIILFLIPTVLILYLTSKQKVILNDFNSKENFILGICGFILGVMPSGLFLLTSITLAVGFVKLAKKNAYIKDLFGIEMLAQINVLCLDKTGTITDGTIEIKEILKYPNSCLISDSLLYFIVNSFPNNNPTQNALYQKFVYDKKHNHHYKILNQRYFSSDTKYSAIEIEKKGTFFVGAPEFILKKQFYQVQKEVEKNSKKGYRVLLLAQTDTKLDQINENTVYKTIYLIILKDRIKKDALKTIQFFQKNGIDIKIISGDNTSTVAYIAQRMNIIDSEKKAISLYNLKDEEIAQVASKYNVFCRTTPEQKKFLIQNFKKKNKKVAMIGDGVNDILAFKEADISIAMSSGSEAARNVANLVLIDSKFKSLPQIVAEGRRVINNLAKVAVSFLVKTISIFLLGLITIILNVSGTKNGFFPLNPIQINIIDIFFIGIPSFFLALESNNQKIKNNFLKMVIKKTLPFSFLIGFNYLFLYLLIPDMKNIFNLNSAFLLLTTALVFFYLLIINCIPFNKSKIILVVGNFLGFSILSYLQVFRHQVSLNQKDKIIDQMKQNIKNHSFIFLILLMINIIFLFFHIYQNKKINKIQQK